MMIKKYIKLKEDKEYDYNNEEFKEKYFIFYDKKHTVIDIKQNVKLKGLVTLNQDSNYTDTAQAMYRLRHLNYIM